MAGSALIDAGHALKDAGELARDGSAHAQCDSCNAPLLAGPITVVTAETDPDRIAGDIIPDTQKGTPYPAMWQELATGPVVITNLVRAGDGNNTVIQLGTSDASPCASVRPLVSIGYGDTYFGLTGLRMLVPKGKVLCGSGDGLARWAGFRPYESDSSAAAAN